MKIDAIDVYWHSFLAKLPVHSNYHYKQYAAEQFGDSPELADELAGLIADGIKTGTCSSLWEWEAEGKFIPQPGMLTIVLNAKEEPLCIIEDTEVYVCRFRDVDDEFAEAEGEGDQTLTYWRAAHTRYFSRILPKIGKEFREDMPVVCERFKVIYR